MECFQATAISTNTTTTIIDVVGNGGKVANEGILGGLIIGNPGAAGGTITIYDNSAASGKVIATIAIAAAQPAATIWMRVKCAIGLTVVTASMTTPSVTVLWR